MHPRDWNICLIEANKFEAQIMVDLLRHAGCERVKVVADSASALDALEIVAANIIIASVESQPIDGITWTKTFRRSPKVVNRKAAIFLTSHAFSRPMAEECRHAGVNALIGKPVSGKILIATLTKVMTHPREFVDAAGYVGPCRRAGIVTAGTTQKRRKIDESAHAEAETSTLIDAVAAMSKTINNLITGTAEIEACQAALKKVQGYAVNAGDGPLMRACAAFGLQLSAKGLRPDATKAALEACMAGVTELAATSVEETERRDAMAERVRQAVAKAASLRAA
jgi:CheY-like chemotaxis protein